MTTFRPASLTPETRACQIAFVDALAAHLHENHGADVIDALAAVLAHAQGTPEELDDGQRALLRTLARHA